MARNNLGVEEFYSFRYSRAMKHYKIGAKMGCEQSFGNIREMYTRGLVPEEDYKEALAGYQEAVKERSSPERARQWTIYGPETVQSDAEAGTRIL